MSEVTNTLVILGLLVPMGAAALGIGEIRAHSALNQRLNAEIPLVLSGNDSLETLRIRLASPEAFARAGVERSQNLTQLRFTAIAKSRGEYVIQVSSSDVVREPFLDFLVEVESPTGTSLREFTLLLDPPPGLNPGDSNAFQSSPSFTPAPTLRYDSPGQQLPVRAEREAGAYSAATTPAPTRREFAISPAQLTLEAYGPVRRGERLLEIAQRIERPASVTPEQMAVGLYLANPRAFQGNPNSLRAGSRLRIPTSQFLTQIATEDYGEMLRGAIPRISNSDRLEPELMPGAAPREFPQQQDRSNGVGPVAEVSARISSALKKENDELREQVSHLEQRLEESQRLLALKSAELAALHQQAMKPKESAESRVSVPPRVDPPKLSEPVPHAPPITQTQPRAPIPSAPPQHPAEPASKPPLVVSQPVQLEQESPIATGFLLASGSLVLVGIGIWLYRRRRATGGGGNLSIMTSPTVSTLSQDQTPATSQTTTAATPLPMPPADTLVAEADVLDPIWEADVYLRYGRFAQAEHMMRDAIKMDPARHDLKLKLLEILHLANKGDAFLDYAQELHTSQPGLTNDFWASVSAIRPDFQPATQAPAWVREVELPQPTESGASSDPMAAAIQLEDIDNTDFSQELAELQAQHEQITQNSNSLAPDAQDESSASESSMPLSMMIEDALEGPAGVTETSDYSAELRELEKQAGIAISEPLNSGTVSLTEDDGPESVTAETPDLNHLIEFEVPQLDSPPQEPDKPDFNLDNLIPFDTTNLNALLTEVTTNPATSGPALTPTSPHLVGIEFAREQDKLPDSSTQRKDPLGSLDFSLELVDPGAPASSELQAGVSSQSVTPTVGPCADLLAQAREFAVNDEKVACRQLLQQVLHQGSPAERDEAEALMQELGKVRLSLVPPPPSRKAS